MTTAGWLELKGGGSSRCWVEGRVAKGSRGKMGTAEDGCPFKTLGFLIVLRCPYKEIKVMLGSLLKAVALKTKARGLKGGACIFSIHLSPWLYHR